MLEQRALESLFGDGGLFEALAFVCEVAGMPFFRHSLGTVFAAIG